MSGSAGYAPTLLSRWRGFVLRYGWRAYALPILVVLTVAALLRGAPHSAAHTVTEGAAAPGLQQHAVAGFDRPARPLAPLTIRTTADTSGCAGNTYSKLALVSLHEQRVWLCDGQRQVYTSLVTTGSSVDGDQTPVGSWHVQSRQRDRYLVGPGYKDYVHYWVPFNGDFGFHDASWQTMAFGSPGYRTKGSHGCVHMPTATMKWFYGWAQVDETVVTVEA